MGIQGPSFFRATGGRPYELYWHSQQYSGIGNNKIRVIFKIDSPSSVC
jgi:hypothetical protein